LGEEAGEGRGGGGGEGMSVYVSVDAKDLDIDGLWVMELDELPDSGIPKAVVVNTMWGDDKVCISAESHDELVACLRSIMAEVRLSARNARRRERRPNIPPTG